MKSAKASSLMMILFSQVSVAAATNYVITAQRISKPIDKVSNSVTVITSKEIEASGAQDLTSLLQAKTGVYISSNGSLGGIATLRIRGGEQGFSKVIIDGIEMVDPSGTNDSFEINQIDLSNIQRIEILKGAQSIIYGPQAMNGVLKIVTKKSKNKESRIKLGYGSFNTKDYSLSSTGQANKVSYSLAASFINTDGISSYNEKRTNFAEKDRYDRMNIKTLIHYKLNTTDKLSYQLFTTKSDLDIDNFGSDQPLKDNSSYDQNSHQVSLNTKHLQGILESDFRLSTTQIYRNSEITSTNTTARDYKASWLGTIYHKRSLSHIMGLDFKSFISKQKFDQTNVERRDSQIYSSFIQSHLDTDLVFGDLGLRLSKQDGQEVITTYKLGIGHNFSKEISLRATYATGFKSPSLYQLSTNDKLESTESSSADVTLSYNGDLHSLELAYFDNSYTNQITYSMQDSAYANIQESNVYGYELSLENKITSKAVIKNSFTLTKSKNEVTGKQLLKTPKKLWNSQVKYQMTPDCALQSNLVYVGQRYEFGQRRMPSYLVVNTSLNYKALLLTINNILDKEYEDTHTYATADRNYRLSYSMDF